MEGYGSVQEYMQAYADLFGLLEREGGGSVPEAPGRMWREITVREQAGGILLPGVCLRGCLELGRTEFLLVMYAACCELDGALRIYCRDRTGGNWPDFRYALHLLSVLEPVDFSVLPSLCVGDGALWEALEPEGERGGSALGKPLYVRKPVLAYLLSGTFPLPEKYCRIWAGPADGLADVHAGTYRTLRGFLEKDMPMTVLLQGREGSGKKTLLKRLCGECGRFGLFLRMAALWDNPDVGTEEREEVFAAVRLACRLWQPVLALDFTGTKPLEEARGLRDILGGYFQDCQIILLAVGREQEDRLKGLSDAALALDEFLTREEKEAAFRLFQDDGEVPGWQRELLGSYRFDIGELSGVLREIRLRDVPGQEEVARKKIWRKAFRGLAARCAFGETVRLSVAPEEFVGSPSVKEQLFNVIKLAANWQRHREEWRGGRFAKEGFILLFYGESGTGKTMSASVLATALNLELFKVDLSAVFDKYIGETEKHLDEIFRAAERGNCVLFFDEADALFSKRTEIRDAHDKYANVSTSYLLQKIEAYDGVVVLATNLLNHFDGAFLRRIRFVVKFRNLEKEERAQLWRMALEGEPKACGVSAEDLAGMAELGPARIKSAALTARMLALSEGAQCVDYGHIRKAVELEAAKDETAVRPLRE